MPAATYQPESHVRRSSRAVIFQAVTNLKRLRCLHHVEKCYGSSQWELEIFDCSAMEIDTILRIARRDVAEKLRRAQVRETFRTVRLGIMPAPPQSADTGEYFADDFENDLAVQVAA